MKNVIFLGIVTASLLLVPEPCHGNLILVGKVSPLAADSSALSRNDPLSEWETTGYISGKHAPSSMRSDERAVIHSQRNTLAFTPSISLKLLVAGDKVSLNAASIPEPSTLLLLGVGLFSFGSFYRRSLRS